MNKKDEFTHFQDINEFSKALLSMIPEGEENAIHMKSLADYLNVEGRDIRREVLNLRRKGNIIASSQNGYFIPKTNDELLKYYRETRGRALTTLDSLKMTRRTLCTLGINPDRKEGPNNDSF